MNNKFYISKLLFSNDSNFDLFKNQYTYLFIQAAGALTYKNKWTFYNTLDNDVSHYLSEKFLSYSDKTSDFLYSTLLISDNFPSQQEFVKSAFYNESSFSRQIDNKKIILMVMLKNVFFSFIKKDFLKYLNHCTSPELPLLFNEMSFNKLNNLSLTNNELFHHTFIFLLFKGLCLSPAFDAFSYYFDRSLKFYERLNLKGKGKTRSVRDLVFISYELDYSCNLNISLVTYRSLSEYELKALSKYLKTYNKNEIFNKTNYISDNGKIIFKNKTSLIESALKNEKFDNLKIRESSYSSFHNSLEVFNFNDLSAFQNCKLGKLYSFVKMMNFVFSDLGLKVDFVQPTFISYANFNSSSEISSCLDLYMQQVNNLHQHYSINLFCADDVDKESLEIYCRKNNIEDPNFKDPTFLLLQFKKILKKCFPDFSFSISKKAFNTNKKIPSYNPDKLNKFNFIICFSKEYYEKNNIKNRDFHNLSLGIFNQHFTVENLISLISNKENLAVPVIQNTGLEMLIRSSLYEDKLTPQKDLNLHSSIMTFVYATRRKDPRSFCKNNSELSNWISYFTFITVDFIKKQILFKDCFSNEGAPDKLLRPYNKIDFSDKKFEEISSFKDRLIFLCQKVAQKYHISNDLIFLAPCDYDENNPISIQDQNLIIVSNNRSYVLPDLDATYKHLSEFDNTAKIKISDLYQLVSANYQDLSDPSGKINILFDYLTKFRKLTINIADLKKALSKLGINGKSAFGVKLSNLIFDNFGSKLYLLSKNEENINNLNIAFYSGIHFSKVDNNHYVFFVSAYNKQDLLKTYSVEKNILLKDIFFYKFNLNTEDYLFDYLNMCSNSFARLICKMFSGYPYQIQMCKHLEEACYKSDIPRIDELPLGVPIDTYSPSNKIS